MIKLIKAGDAIFKVTVTSSRPKTNKGKRRFYVGVHLMGKKFRRCWSMGSDYTQQMKFVAKKRGR